MSAVWLAASTVLAACTGAVAGTGALAQIRERRRRRQARAHAREGSADRADALQVQGLAQRVLAILQEESRRVQVRRDPVQVPFARLVDPAPSLLAHAGRQQDVTVAGVRAASVRLALGAGALGGVLGAVLSLELGVAGCAIGAVAGACMPRWALRQEARLRGQDAERHLSEMVEVLILGLRSGLSFERAFALYPRYFDTALARSAARTVAQWDTGLVRREEALRAFAAGYDSALLDRVVENSVRALRFGSPLADALEAAAAESRALHKARMEERIAKAPVRMMLPVGTLILPAMLLLVMGPVVLELMTEI